MKFGTSVEKGKIKSRKVRSYWEKPCRGAFLHPLPILKWVYLKIVVFLNVVILIEWQLLKSVEK